MPCVLRRFGLDDLADSNCGSLAHGTKRLVEVARAICLEPMVLLLDEPAAGLNESEQAELAEHLQVLASAGLTLLIIEHNMEFLKTLATRRWSVLITDSSIASGPHPQRDLSG